MPYVGQMIGFPWSRSPRYGAVMQKSVKASSILPGLKPDKFSRLPVVYNKARESLARSKVQEEEKSAQFADKGPEGTDSFFAAFGPHFNF